MRLRDEAPRPDPRTPAREDVQFTRASWRGWDVWTLSAADDDSRSVVVGLHGGAYVLEVQDPFWDFCCEVVRQRRATVIVPLYPLAPSGNAAEVVPATADLLTEIVAQHEGLEVSVFGDSAGGGLALASVQMLVAWGHRPPRGLTLISPWLDVTMSDPRSRLVNDPMLDVENLLACGRMWAGDLDPRDPRVSPLFGNLQGLPPVYAYTSSLDAVRPDVERLHLRAGGAGLDLTVTDAPGLLHVWPIFLSLPEARRELPRLLDRVCGLEAGTARDA